MGLETLATLATPETLALTATAVGVGAQISGTLQQGRQAEKIAEARAAIDLQKADAIRKASVEEAKIKTERGKRLIELQKSQAAVGNIRINVGAPLVIEAETQDLIAQEIGFVLETGRAESDFFRSSAALEIAQGKALKRRSKFDAIRRGLTGFGSIAFMGTQGGRTPTPSPGVRDVSSFTFV